MPIEIDIQGADNLKRVADKVFRAPDEIAVQLESAAKVFMFEAEGRSKKDYLTGPRPQKLGVVTGRLRASIASRVQRQGDTIDAILGTNVRYARVHELGFSGNENVKTHQRVVKKAFGRSISPVSSTVRAHTRRVNILARPFLSPAVQDALPNFEETIRRIMGKIIVEESGGE